MFLRHSGAAILRLPCCGCQLPCCQQGQQYQSHHPTGDCCHCSRTAKSGRVNSDEHASQAASCASSVLQRAAMQVSKSVPRPFRSPTL
jgi:hypothetical protein